MNITKKQLINFLKNKNINIYLLNGWSTATPRFDFINSGLYGLNFGVKVCNNGDVEIYKYRTSEAFNNMLINKLNSIEIK